ncbi:NitT/TauT family transport system substrate-binding protein [Halopseudomonas xinjiangensis]|uniref:NitT/TauT family transport system substrate-binding protein n=1 Tax=Halopseudomonas xinjiangensis TaxID=487184 RepID=A0A1H1QH77_9GAMM|nr:ABC transporter substrate-binding protein [Halopseudomonas xinjiangensis]SDS22842.1 NitT/TauT family transport system substrate-binding protein [Halopseudomonas xinjiangensis]
MKAKLWLVPALLLVSAFAQAQETLKVGFIRVMDDAQVMVAKEAGLYEKHGLNVELVEFSSGTDLIKAIVGGQLDTGVLGFSNAVAWASKGANLKVVGGAQRGYHSILAREDSGINTLADLKGKTLASQREGSTADSVLRGVTLKSAELEPGDLNIMGVSPAVAVQSLVSGRVDAAFLFEPYDRIAQLVAPVKQIYEIGEVWPFPCMVVITAGETLDKRKEAIWSSLDAQREAIDMLENKPAQAAELIASYFIAEPTLKTLNRGEVPREKVIEEAISTQDFDAGLSEQDLSRIQELADIMQEQGSLTTRDGKPFDTQSILDLSWQQARDL